MLKVRRRSLGVAFVIVGVAAAGFCLWYGQQSVGVPDPARVEADRDFEPNKSLLDRIRKSDRVILFEGLPHQFYESEMLDAELRQKPTVTLHGFPFYTTPLEFDPEDAARLKVLLAEATPYPPYKGEPACGGFHPDYLVEYVDRKATYRVLVCFGCGELRIFGPDRSLKCRFESCSQGPIYDLLMKYRKNRPPRER